jgi:hypothetical protein
MQSILTNCAAVISSLNNALQLPGRIAEVRRSKWFPAITVGMALVVGAAISWFARDWMSTRNLAPGVATTAPVPKPAEVSQTTPNAGESTVQKLQATSRPSKPTMSVAAAEKIANGIRVEYLETHPSVNPTISTPEEVSYINRQLKNLGYTFRITLPKTQPRVPCAAKHGIVMNGDDGEISDVKSYVCFDEDVLHITGNRNKAHGITMNPPANARSGQL